MKSHFFQKATLAFLICFILASCKLSQNIDLTKLRLDESKALEEAPYEIKDSKFILRATEKWGQKTSSFASSSISKFDLQGGWTLEGKIVFKSDLLGQQGGLFVGDEKNHYRIVLGRLATHQGVPFNIALTNSQNEKVSIGIPNYRLGDTVELRISKIESAIWGFYRLPGGSWNQVGSLTFIPSLVIKQGVGLCLMDENPYKNEKRIPNPSLIQNGILEAKSLIFSEKVDRDIIDSLPKVYVRIHFKEVGEGSQAFKVGYTLYRQMQDRLFQGGISRSGTLQATQPVWGASIPWNKIESTFRSGETSEWQDFSHIFSTPLTTSVFSLSFFQEEQGKLRDVDLGNVSHLNVQVDFASKPDPNSIIKTLNFKGNYPTIGFVFPENKGSLSDWGREIRLTDEYVTDIVQVYRNQGISPIAQPEWLKISGSFHEGYFGSLYSPLGDEAIRMIYEMIGIHTPSTMVLPIFSGVSYNSEGFNIWDPNYVSNAKKAILNHPNYERIWSKLPKDRSVYIKFGDEFHLMPIETIQHFPLALEDFRSFLKSKQITLEMLGKKNWNQVIPLAKSQIKNNGDAVAHYWTVWFQQIKSNQMYSKHRQIIREIWGSEAYAGGSNYFAGFNVAPDYFVEAREKGMDVQAHHYGSGDTVSPRQVNADLFVADLLRSAANQGEIKKGVLSFASRIGNGVGTQLSNLAALIREMQCFYYYGMGPQITGWEWFVDDREKVDAFWGVHQTMKLGKQYEKYLQAGRKDRSEVGLIMSRSSVIWADFSDDQLVQIFGYDEAKAKKAKRDLERKKIPAVGWLTERRLTHSALNWNNYMTDIVPEETVETGKLESYKVLYLTEPNLSEKAQRSIRSWVEQGGVLYLGAEAATRNEYNQPLRLLDLFIPSGIHLETKIEDQSSAFPKRGGFDEVWEVKSSYDQDEITSLNVIDQMKGTKNSHPVLVRREKMEIPDSQKIASFENGDAAYVSFAYKKGRVYKSATCLGTIYGRSAKPAFSARTETPIPRDSMTISGTTAFYQRQFDSELEGWLIQPAVDAGVKRVVSAEKSGFDTGLFENKNGAVLLIGRWNDLNQKSYRFNVELDRFYKNVKSFSGKEVKVTWVGNRATVDLPVDVIEAVEFTN